MPWSSFELCLAGCPLLDDFGKRRALALKILATVKGDYRAILSEPRQQMGSVIDRLPQFAFALNLCALMKHDLNSSFGPEVNRGEPSTTIKARRIPLDSFGNGLVRPQNR